MASVFAYVVGTTMRHESKRHGYFADGTYETVTGLLGQAVTGSAQAIQ